MVITKNPREEQSEFLKFAISYIENRINLLDTKASILIAVQTLLLGLITYFTIEVLSIRYSTIFFVIMALILAGFSIGYLIQTIRPTKKFIGLNVPEFLLQKDQNKYVFWFRKRNGVPKNFDDYKKQLADLTDQDLSDNYQKAHFFLLKLVQRKYGFYRRAVWIMKIMVIFVVLWLFILLISGFGGFSLP